MIKHLLISIAVGLVLPGCASSPPSIAGQTSDLRRNYVKQARAEQYLPVLASARNPNAEKEISLATLRPHSHEWAVLYEEIEAEENRRIDSLIVICRGCFPVGEDYTGSVPKN